MTGTRDLILLSALATAGTVAGQRLGGILFRDSYNETLKTLKIGALTLTFFFFWGGVPYIHYTP